MKNSIRSKSNNQIYNFQGSPARRREYENKGASPSNRSNGSSTINIDVANIYKNSNAKKSTTHYMRTSPRASPTKTRHKRIVSGPVLGEIEVFGETPQKKHSVNHINKESEFKHKKRPKDTFTRAQEIIERNISRDEKKIFEDSEKGTNSAKIIPRSQADQQTLLYEQDDTKKTYVKPKSTLSHKKPSTNTKSPAPQVSNKNYQPPEGAFRKKTGDTGIAGSKRVNDRSPARNVSRRNENVEKKSVSRSADKVDKQSNQVERKFREEIEKKRKEQALEQKKRDDEIKREKLQKEKEQKLAQAAERQKEKERIAKEKREKKDLETKLQQQAKAQIQEHSQDNRGKSAVRRQDRKDMENRAKEREREETLERDTRDKEKRDKDRADRLEKQRELKKIKEEEENERKMNEATEKRRVQEKQKKEKERLEQLRKERKAELDAQKQEEQQQQKEKEAKAKEEKVQKDKERKEKMEKEREDRELKKKLEQANKDADKEKRDAEKKEEKEKRDAERLKKNEEKKELEVNTPTRVNIDRKETGRNQKIQNSPLSPIPNSKKPLNQPKSPTKSPVPRRIPIKSKQPERPPIDTKLNNGKKEIPDKKKKNTILDTPQKTSIVTTPLNGRSPERKKSTGSITPLRNSINNSPVRKLSVISIASKTTDNKGLPKINPASIPPPPKTPPNRCSIQSNNVIKDTLNVENITKYNTRNTINTIKESRVSLGYGSNDDFDPNMTDSDGITANKSFDPNVTISADDQNQKIGSGTYDDPNDINSVDPHIELSFDPNADDLDADYNSEEKNRRSTIRKSKLEDDRLKTLNNQSSPIQSKAQIDPEDLIMIQGTSDQILIKSEVVCDEFGFNPQGEAFPLRPVEEVALFELSGKRVKIMLHGNMMCLDTPEMINLRFTSHNFVEDISQIAKHNKKARYEVHGAMVSQPFNPDISWTPHDPKQKSHVSDNIERSILGAIGDEEQKHSQSKNDLENNDFEFSRDLTPVNIEAGQDNVDNENSYEYTEGKLTVSQTKTDRNRMDDNETPNHQKVIPSELSEGTPDLGGDDDDEEEDPRPMTLTQGENLMQLKKDNFNVISDEKDTQKLNSNNLVIRGSVKTVDTRNSINIPRLSIPVSDYDPNGMDSRNSINEPRLSIPVSDFDPNAIDSMEDDPNDPYDPNYTTEELSEENPSTNADKLKKEIDNKINSRMSKFSAQAEGNNQPRGDVRESVMTSEYNTNDMLDRDNFEKFGHTDLVVDDQIVEDPNEDKSKDYSQRGSLPSDKVLSFKQITHPRRTFDYQNLKKLIRKDSDVTNMASRNTDENYHTINMTELHDIVIFFFNKKNLEQSTFHCYGFNEYCINTPVF